jgi:hypothetical protein
VLLYRVFGYLASAAEGESGNPEYLFRPQGRGRVDNPKHYDVWYLSRDASGAVGEVLGDFSEWTDDVFETPYLPGGRRALGIYSIPDGTPTVDLDDANNLLDRGLRPTQIIARNRPVTQGWALKIFQEQNSDGSRKWDGVSWWSYHRPEWQVYGLWIKPQIQTVEELTLSHSAVRDAGRLLARPLP